MIDIVLLSNELRRDEAVRAKPYRDTVGKLTIGVGRNLDDRGLSSDEIDYLLKNDIQLVLDELDKRLPWWRRMSLARQRALANFVFNVGMPTALTFKRSLALLESGKYDDAADAMMQSKWAQQVGERAKRVTELIRKG